MKDKKLLSRSENQQDLEKVRKTKKISRPRVSVLMPCRNEEKFIKKAVKSLVNDYFLKNCELIVIDGMSTDRTRDIAHSFHKQGLPVRILENTKKLQSFGLNLGISKARGEIIVRADAHCVYPQDYIKKCVRLLELTGAANVGGMMFPQGKTPVQKAIALAMQHPAGVGDAKFHLGNYTGYVDTVYLGTFWKKLFDELGPYDQHRYGSEDPELNLRITKAGKKIFLDSSIKVFYFPRESLKALAKQYHNYGRGRCYISLKHQKLTSFRQLGPTILAVGLFFSIILGIWKPLFFIIPFSYFFILLLIALLSWSGKHTPLKQKILTALIWGIMHLSWGWGFLFYFILRK